MEGLKQDVSELKQDVTDLKKEMNHLKGEFGRFKGKKFERTVRERYPAYLGRLLRKAKLRTFEELLEWVSEAEDKGLQKEVIPVVIFAEGKDELEGLAQKKGVLALKVPY